MEKYQQEERKLCFMDCIWNMFFKWRVLILAVVFFAVLFGVLKYAKDYKEQEETENNKIAGSTVDDIQAQLHKLTDIDRAKAETAMHFVKSLCDKKKYAKDSAVMKLDSYDVNRVVLCYNVKSEKNTSDLVQAYSNAYLKPEALSLLADESNGTMKNSDIADMITAKYGEATFETYNANEYTISVNDENAFLYITVRGSNEEQAQKLAGRIKHILQEYFAEAEKMYGTHSLMLMSESCLSGRDYEITKVQDEVFKTIYEMSRDIADSTGKMSKEAAQVIDNYTVALDKEMSEESDSKVEVTEKSERIKISVSKKWGFFGAVFGVLFIGSIEVLKWLVGGKLNSSEELQQNFDIHIYGTIEERKRHKVLGVIDELIYKLKNRNKKILNEKQNFRMILSGICLDAKRRGISSIYMTGTEIESISEKTIINELKRELVAEEVDLIIGQSILYDSKALLKMAQTGCVILAEETGYSKYQEIIREIEMCQNQSVSILGCIVFTH